MLLVVRLDFTQFFENLFIVLEFTELLKLVCVINKAAADKLCEKCGKLGV